MDSRRRSEEVDEAGSAHARHSVAPGKMTRTGAIMRSPRDGAPAPVSDSTAPAGAAAPIDLAAGFCYFGGDAATLDESNAREVAKGGSPLPADTRAAVEHATGRDLSAARVHRDDASAERADALDARAFTVGTDIHLGAGEADDPWLLAHEATHVAQQQGVATGPQAKSLRVVSEDDPAERQADQVADAVVAGHTPPLAALAPVAGGTAARGPKTKTKPADKPSPAYLVEPPSLKSFDAALIANDATAALTIWRAVAFEGGRDRITVTQLALVANVLAPADAMAVFTDLGYALDSVVVVTSLATTTRVEDWHKYLDKIDALEMLATCDVTQHLAPALRKGMDAILKAPGSKYGKPELRDPDRALEMRLSKDKPPAVHPFTVSERAGAKLKVKPKPPYKDMWWNWMLTVDKPEYLTAGAPHDLGKDATLIEAHTGPTVTYDLKPAKVDAEATTVNLDLRVEVMTASGVLGTNRRVYELTIWPDLDPDDRKAFDKAFARDFAEVCNAPPFAEYASGKKAWADLFTSRQRKMLAEQYLAGGRVVPAELFTGEEHHQATSVQRVLLASAILTNGVVETKEGGVVSAAKWWSTNCGTWVNGVYIYAGANYSNGSMAGGNYVSPTGEVSVGAGTLQSGKPTNEESLKPGVSRVKQGLTGTTTQNKANFGPEIIFKAGTIEPGDWLYIDNGNTQSHSIVFLGWKKAGTSKKKPEFATSEADIATGSGTVPLDAWEAGWSPAKETAVAAESGRADRDVTWRSCYAYSQHRPGEGGAFDEYKVGFPASLYLGVVGVWALSKATRVNGKGEREDVQPANTLGELLLPLEQVEAKPAKSDGATTEAKPAPTLSAIIGELGLDSAVATNRGVVGKGDPAKLLRNLAKAATTACNGLAGPQQALCTPYLDTSIVDRATGPLAGDTLDDVFRQITILVCLIQRFAGATARNVHTGGRGSEGADPRASGLLTDIDQTRFVPKKDAKAAAAAEKAAKLAASNQEP